MRLLSLAVSSVLLLPGAAAAQSAPLGPTDSGTLPPEDLDRVAVGSPAPDFVLDAYGGGTVRLSDLRGAKNVVLVFYRGYWCPFCIQQLSELRSLLEADLEADTELLVVSIDGPEETRIAVSRIAPEDMEPGFTFLSDPESAVIGRYGILNPSGSRRGIPHPATYVIDKEGTVRWKFVETDYRVRPENAEIREALRDLP